MKLHAAKKMHVFDANDHTVFRIRINCLLCDLIVVGWILIARTNLTSDWEVLAHALVCMLLN